jgi:hypothetical protein
MKTACIAMSWPDIATWFSTHAQTVAPWLALLVA